MPVDDPNVGVAFALVIGAGLSTCLGAAVVFFPRLVKLASKRVLAAALGLSAGVMVYVSFVEIFEKSKLSFVESGMSKEHATLYATLCFFAGVCIMLVIDFLVRIITGHKHHHDHPVGEQTIEVQGYECFTCSPDPVGDLEDMQNQADSIILRENRSENEAKSSAVDSSEKLFGGMKEYNSDENASDVEDEEEAKNEETRPEGSEKKKLIKMGINTAVAIALHNFPEGLATFVAALDDPKVGAVLAIAIGIHNIPEGLCVALPIYYATGNRLKAFGWAVLSGASEPIAALLGWAILANSFSHQLYAVLFGIVAGMMVIISTRELLPTAHRYDPEDTVVTYSFIIGMCIIAVSLVLFLF
mmetsp:Transcript_26935/g.39844  ORF Transcript_26935/g.39844 Transcript_26935/m.39844 type:complete len:358 (+) Transcript_26935:83-1156(+)|eukprot:CAMPEP_0194198946 /NCGR_PEP_ID=MMETSP0156-20130528/149_1 /TAXON_ID=33649 /ORGANISM="Thalassionema nitzschioides, Strain L26-B" /LENGTH=357 /DNA_ID=CAMNT_0038923779 /DNA_START=54 /DNA_END=1127 /DNA_ORIENTATION=+